MLAGEIAGDVAIGHRYEGHLSHLGNSFRLF